MASWFYVLDGATLGPEDESSLARLARDGTIVGETPVWRDGMVQWQAAKEVLPGLFAPVAMSAPSTAPASSVATESRLFSQYDKDVRAAAEALSRAEPQRVAQADAELERRIGKLQKQADVLRSQFPDTPEAQLAESTSYLWQARAKVGHTGFLRRVADKQGNLMIALVARQQEKANAIQALSLLDKSISIYDDGEARVFKAAILVGLGRKAEASEELGYVISTFAGNDESEEAYVQARQMKDDLDSSGKSGCFVATAACGSRLAPEVVYLLHVRDDVLLRTSIGSTLVAAYCRLSPPLASVIATHVALRLAVRHLCIVPLVFVLKAVERLARLFIVESKSAASPGPGGESGLECNSGGIRAEVQSVRGEGPPDL